ncbi:CoA transferase [Streptomyces sp. SID8374]|uniref:CoA transferase n=1 Tax=Streptomyces sp. SID8374 TaxID=2690354 RepID=UPI00136908C0|nr:CoA transferase [Streptomyces sp. SID8374]MYX14561.1 CoA transferase [Streptomyces sp. SID8374]
MTSAPPLSPLTTSEALPLDGHLVHLPPAPPAGLATATEVVRDHLTRLGARFGPDAGPWHGSGSPHTAHDRYATAGPETVIGLGGPHHSRGTDLTLRGWPAGDPTPFDETTAQAATGLMALHGRANGGPRPLGVDYLSTLAGTVATQALLAAALSGLRGTPVRSARVSVAEAALFSLGPYVAAATAGDEPEDTPSPPYRRAARPPFLSADGVRFEVEALEVQPWRDFWRAVGAPAKDIANSWRAFSARSSRAASPLITTLAQCAARHRYADLLLLAERTGMGICALRTLADRRADSDVRYDDDPWELRELPRDEDGGLPVPPYTSSRPHTGFPQLPLGGLRIVESTRGVQGPLATSVLQALGAHVIRIEQPGGDPARGAAPLAGGVSARFAALNAGKEVRETDIRTAAGRRAVAETVAEADVFLHTWAPGEAARLRLDEADLARARPGLIYAWDRAPDGPRPPWTDPMVQAWSGVADTVRTPEGTPAPSLVTLLDILGGHLAAESVLAALLARESGAATGRLRVDSSLLGASRVLLRPLLRGLDESPGTPPSKAGLVAPTADGLIAVGAGAGTTPAELATEPSATWLKRFHAAGVPAREVVTDIASLPQDSALSPYFTHDGCARPTPPWSFS